MFMNKFVWYKLAGVTSVIVKLPGFYKPSHYSEHLAVVMHNTFTTVYGHMRCSGSYKYYKLLCEFAMVVENMYVLFLV